MIDTLRRQGYETVLAYYEPYSLSPHVSVPSFRLLRRRVESEDGYTPDGGADHAYKQYARSASNVRVKY
jgi:hypothetical protein